MTNDNHQGITYHGTGNQVTVTSSPGDSTLEVASCLDGVPDAYVIHNDAGNCLRMHDKSSGYAVYEETNCNLTDTICPPIVVTTYMGKITLQATALTGFWNPSEPRSNCQPGCLDHGPRRTYCRLVIRPDRRETSSGVLVNVGHQGTDHLVLLRQRLGAMWLGRHRRLRHLSV